MSAVSIITVAGAALQARIEQLAALRIRVFRDFPYLYDGTIEYEQKYLQTYIDHPDSVIVLAFDDVDNKIVGASTAIPMRDETAELQKPFLEHGYDIN